MTKAQSIQQFWESASALPCYEENDVPDNPSYPYLAYQLNTGGFGDVVPMTASLYYRSTKWTDINAKAESISDYIGMGGKKSFFDGGAVWITRAKTFAQHYGEASDKGVRRIVLTIDAEFQK